MSPNEYYKSLGARNFGIGWSLHLAKLVGAKWHSHMTWGEFCEKMKFVVFEM